MLSSSGFVDGDILWLRPGLEALLILREISGTLVLPSGFESCEEYYKLDEGVFLVYHTG